MADVSRLSKWWRERQVRRALARFAKAGGLTVAQAEECLRVTAMVESDEWITLRARVSNARAGGRLQ